MKELLREAKAIKTLFEVSDEKRVRNSTYLRHKVGSYSRIREGNTVLVEAEVNSYKVELEVVFRETGLPKVTHRCTCRDHGRQGACKHVLAVGYKRLKTLRDIWVRLDK